MPHICGICNTVVNRSSTSVLCCACKKQYHLKCLETPNMPDLNKFPGLQWMCAHCIGLGEGGNNRDGIIMQPSNDGTDTILAKLNDIQKDLKLVKQQQSDIVTSLEFYGRKIDDFNDKINKFENQIEVIPKLEINVHANTSEISVLKEELNKLQQRSRINNIEINGITVTPNENVMQIVKCAINTLGIEGEVVVDACHRVPHMDSNNKRPYSIIARLATHNHKEKILEAIRAKKGLSTHDMGLPGDNVRVYINDHLTPQNKVLHRKTREFCKSFNTISWIRDCKILMRHPRTGKTFHIFNESVLRNISQSLT